MPIFQIIIGIKPYKTEEFINAMGYLSERISKEQACLGYTVCRDSGKRNVYKVTGEWETRKAMERHFRTQEFGLVIGAARVLGETFNLSIAEVSKKGGFEFAKELMNQR